MSQPLLTDADKQRIREEEIFRNETQKTLNPPVKENPVWSFVNSSFGIWFLSTIVLSSGLWLFQRGEEKEKERQRLYRTKAELMHNFYTFDDAINTAWDFTSYSSLYGYYLQRPKYEFLEFKDMTMKEVLWRLGEIPPEQNVKDARAQNDAISDIWAVIAPLQSFTTITQEQKTRTDEQIRLVLKKRVYPIYTKSWDH